jgi:hypothetical protein
MAFDLTTVLGTLGGTAVVLGVVGKAGYETIKSVRT